MENYEEENGLEGGDRDVVEVLSQTFLKDT
jgi:hypothetical protein